MGPPINGGTPIARWFLSWKSHLEIDDAWRMITGGTPMIMGNPHMINGIFEIPKREYIYSLNWNLKTLYISLMYGRYLQ